MELNNKKSKYLLWTSSFFPRVGGLENASKEYALHMKKQGWDVHIITNRYPRSLPGKECLDGINIFRYFFFHAPLNYIRNRRPDLFFCMANYETSDAIQINSLFLSNSSRCSESSLS